MPNSPETPRDILKKYADILIANAQASTKEELGEVADELIYVTEDIEKRGEEIAQLIYELLEPGQRA